MPAIIQYVPYLVTAEGGRGRMGRGDREVVSRDLSVDDHREIIKMTTSITAVTDDTGDDAETEKQTSPGR